MSTRPVIFFTGFPGFLGSELLPRVLTRLAGAEAVCLVQGKFMAQARERVASLGRLHPKTRGRISLVEGDITRRGLGLRDASPLCERIVEIFHLAAVYDLSVPRELAMRVNVQGTRHMLAFARRCPTLQRFQYVSTCYVAGRHPGLFTEDMLDESQTFNNAYEETKFLAEVEVRRAMRRGLPVTIYRPAVVVGDSTTGHTQKYDGPYFAMQWLLRQPRVAVMPVVGDTRRSHFNAVPRDFVVNAIAYLSGRPESRNRVYQLADPHAPTVREMLRDMAHATHRAVIPVRLPLGVAKTAIAHVPGVYGLLRIPASAIDYFVLPATFGTANAERDLEGSGIRCPPFREYAGRLVDFMLDHPDLGASAMT
jgi:thioester reductase-like protein